MNTLGARVRNFFATSRTNKIIALVVVLLVAITGIVYVVVRAGYFAAIDPSQSTISGNAKVISDSGALNGNAVQFMAPSIPTPPTGEVFPDANSAGIELAMRGKLVDAKNNPDYDASKGIFFAQTPGQTIENLDIVGYISVSQDNVTIKNVRVRCTNGALAGAIHQGVGVKNTTITHVQIIGSTTTQCQYGILSAGTNLTVTFSDISQVSDAISPNDGFDIEDNYIHDFTFFPGDHVACVGYDGGNSLPFTIRHNTCDDQQQDRNNVLALYSQNGSITNATVDHNWLAGSGHLMWAGGYPADCSSSPGVHDVKITNNRFSTKYFPDGGEFTYAVGWCPNAPGNVWSNNTWIDGPRAGQQVPAP